MEIEEQGVSRLRNSHFWPISSDGPLSNALFSDDHLREMFLTVLPGAFKISARDVKKALKSLIKSEPTLRGKEPADDDERAKWTVSIVCNHSVLRRKLPATGLFQPRRRYPNQLSRSKYPNDLSNILWQAYIRLPSMSAMVDRLNPLLVKDPRLSEGVHLTLAAVNDPNFLLIMGEDLATPDFARTAIIFSALLPHEERLKVLNILHENGCQPLASLLDAPPGDAH